MTKVIDFAKARAARHIDDTPEEMDHELDMARHLMKTLVIELSEYRYDPWDEQLSNDLGVIYNMLYAMMCRTSGSYHQFHEMMEELSTELRERAKQSEGECEGDE